MFELSNEQRKYLGLKTVPKSWDRVILKGDTYRLDSILYYEKNTIKKQIISTEFEYNEKHYNEQTDDRKMLLPKTKKGKPKKLTSSTLESRTAIGVYFDFSKNGVKIGNHTTQNTHYSSHFENIEFNGIIDLKKWLKDYISNSTTKDLQVIKEFRLKKRTRINLKEGDFFSYKVDRWNYGFGRLIFDIRKFRKSTNFNKKNNYGLSNLMTQPLVIQIYHIISAKKDIELEYLKKLEIFPSQYIMDNLLYYGDYEIIGNIELEPQEIEFPVSYSSSINYNDLQTVYLQYGKIYKETNEKKYNKYLDIYNPNPNAENWDKVVKSRPYRKESIGFSLNITKEILEKCIAKGTNDPYWNDDYFEREYDLRNPKNKKIKTEIFKHFGLDADKTYYENLKNENGKSSNVWQHSVKTIAGIFLPQR